MHLEVKGQDGMRGIVMRLKGKQQEENQREVKGQDGIRGTVIVLKGNIQEEMYQKAKAQDGMHGIVMRLKGKRIEKIHQEAKDQGVMDDQAKHPKVVRQDAKPQSLETKGMHQEMPGKEMTRQEAENQQV